MFTCALCGGTILVGFRTITGDSYCYSHRDLPRCTFCGAPTNQSTGLCLSCGATAVLDQDGVKRTLPGVRAELRAMGIKLAVPVRVTLVSAQAMASIDKHRTGTTSGLTITQGQQVLSISVVSGLPALEFGSVVAHECMHAWMAQQGFPRLAEPIAEGLCQLAAYGWLRRQPGPLARALQQQIETLVDPVYGDGFRLVRDSVRKHGLRHVLATVHRTGQLP